MKSEDALGDNNPLPNDERPIQNQRCVLLTHDLSLKRRTAYLDKKSAIQENQIMKHEDVLTSRIEKCTREAKIEKDKKTEAQKKRAEKASGVLKRKVERQERLKNSIDCFNKKVKI